MNCTLHVLIMNPVVAYINFTFEEQSQIENVISLYGTLIIVWHNIFSPKRNDVD